MDFIDFEQMHIEGDLPQPQPSLSLPNMENFGKKFTNLNSFTRSLLKRETISTKEDQLADKYAALSLNMISPDENVDELDEKNFKPSTSGSDSKLSARLSRVLTQPLPDHQIREIFTTLEQKLTNIDELVEPETMGSLSRKNLRFEIESDLLKSQGAILKEYNGIYKNLIAFDTRLQRLNDIHKEILNKVNTDLTDNVEFTNEIKELTKQRDELDLKKALLITFRKNFTLNEYEEHCLVEGEINEDYFNALKRAEQIHGKCSVLLSSDNPQLGLKIMAKMNNLIQKGLSRITTFCAKTLSNLHSLNTKDRLKTLHQSLDYLSSKPSYLSNTLSQYSEARAKTIIDEFLNQVSGNYYNSDSLSISAHDSVRFVGDLLAYTHSVAVNEKETIQTIFKNSIDTQTTVLSPILKSLAKPLNSRIDQVIVMESKLSTIDSIRKTIALYMVMFKRQKIDSLIPTLEVLHKSAVDKIESTLKNKLHTIRNSNQAQLEIDSGLQLPDWISEFYSLILPLIDDVTQDTILGLELEESNNFAQFLINEPIEIFTQHVNKANLNTKDKLIIFANYYDFVLSRITPITVLNDKVLELSQAENKVAQDLVQDQLMQLFIGCGINEYVNLINMISPFDEEFFDVQLYAPIVENKLFTKENLLTVNTKIHEFLPTAILDMQQGLLKLNSPVIANTIIKDSSIQFIKFWKFFTKVTQEYLGEIISWSDTEVATLLGVEKEI